MTPLETNATNQSWNLNEIAEGCRPVGNGQPCVVAGDRRARHDDEKREARGEHREDVVWAIVRSGDALQNLLLGPKTLPLEEFRNTFGSLLRGRPP